MDKEENGIIQSKPTQMTKWDKPMQLTNLSANELRFLGQMMADSGMFPDLQKDAAKAIVKIAAGQEIGVPPFQAMTGINIIQGKAAMGSNLMAAKLKGHPKYDYRTTILSSEACEIKILQRVDGKWEEIGVYKFTMDDAAAAGLANKDNWKKYPQNMLYARAISNAIRLFAPDVFNGALVYDPDELGAITDNEGTITAGATGDPELEEAEEKIASAKDEDQLTDIVTGLKPEIQKKVTQQATLKFQELTSNEDPKEA